jgi:hypothetical protein
VETFIKRWIDEVTDVVRAHYSDCIEVFVDPPSTPHSLRTPKSSDVGGPNTGDVLVCSQDEACATSSVRPDKKSSKLRLEGEANVYPGEVCSIISFRIQVEDPTSETGKRYLTVDEYKAFHSKLLVSHFNSAIADQDRNDASSSQGASVHCSGSKVMLGQCVKLVDEDTVADNGGAVLRIALGADTILRALQPDQGLWYAYPSSGRVQPNLLDAERKKGKVTGRVSGSGDASGNGNTETTVYVPEMEAEVDEDEADMGLSGDEVWDLEVALTSCIAEDACALAKIAWQARNWHDILANRPQLVDRALRRRFQQVDKALHLHDSYFEAKYAEDVELNGVTVDTKVSEALKVLLSQQPSGSSNRIEVAAMLDVDALTDAFALVARSFASSADPASSSRFLHCMAIKSCPVSFVLHLAVRSGLGLEAASIGEVKHGLRCGCEPHKIVFDRCVLFQQMQLIVI